MESGCGKLGDQPIHLFEKLRVLHRQDASWLKGFSVEVHVVFRSNDRCGRHASTLLVPQSYLRAKGKV